MERQADSGPLTTRSGRRWLQPAAAPVLAALAMALLPAGTRAAEIKVLSANAVRDALMPTITAFEQATGHKVTISWGGTEAITKRVADGEFADVALIGSASIDRLMAAGKLTSGSRTDFANTGIGVAIRAGLPRPDVSTADALKQAVLDARAIAYSTGPSGFYLVSLFDKMGITDRIKHKVKQPVSGAQTADLLARGDADLGFQQVSELVHAKGVDYLCPLPATIQNITIYSAGVHPATKDRAAVDAFLGAITSPSAAAPIRNAGMQPGGVLRH
jgi:molybdate transport system substrate-binding protein